MPFIQGSKLDKYFRGSLVHRVNAVDAAVAERFADAKAQVMVVREDVAVVVVEGSPVLLVHYEMDGDIATITKESVCKDVPVVESEDMDAFIAGELRDIAQKMAMGESVSRTQVRELASMVEPGGEYWLTGLLAKMDEAAGESDWFKMYEANQEKIRTSMHGSLKAIEGVVPRTKYASISPKKLHAFEEEIKESMGAILSVIQGIVDECDAIMFDQKEDEFFGATCESLKVEAQVLTGLLGKAEKLMRSEDMERMSVAHDKLAGRAKQMAVVAAYLKKRSANEVRS